MNKTHPWIRPLVLLACWIAALATASGEAGTRISSRFLARGEQALLEITVVGSQPTGQPVMPAVKGVEIAPVGRGLQTKLLPGRRFEYVFEYLVSSYETGDHVIPSIEVLAGAERWRTEPVAFKVFNPDELQWSEAEIGGIRFRYATAFRVLNATPYVGEVTPVEIKLFVPRDLFVEDWGIPDFERDGLTAWRFQPSLMRGQVNLLGVPHLSVAYPSTLAPSREGRVGIGPAKVRLTTTRVVMDGVLRRISEEVHVDVPRLDLEARALPAGAPAGFENAVGSFRMKVDAEVTELNEGDPVPVGILISGSGNLDTLRPPKPADVSGWKVYEATADQRGTERHELSGMVSFRQFLRPLELKPALPSFRFVYFDPAEGAYKTLTSEPVPLKITPVSAPQAVVIAPPQASAVPVERMTDILGILPGAPAVVPGQTLPPAWVWHLAGSIVAMVLVVKAVWMRIGHRFRRDPQRARRLADWRTVAGSAAKDDVAFLLAAGRFVEQWAGAEPSSELRAVLAERDAWCFRDTKPAGPVLASGRRREILRVLRKVVALTVVVVLGGLATPRAMAAAGDDAKPGADAAADGAAKAVAAYEAARYDDAISAWLQVAPYDSLSADTLYNIGNACYRAGSPGHAALYYRRALARNAAHEEARQNLRFIERKHGAITVRRPDYQYALARIPLGGWKAMVGSALWVCLLALLVIPATRPGSKWRVAAGFAWVFGPLLLACGWLGWRYFPNDAEFAPPARQAVIVAPDAVLHADAARTSPEVIDAPPGSLCEVVRESGRWCYVSFATKTRGWITRDAIEWIVPHEAPAPPRIRKPKADGKSA